ncbi:hypothetical protein PFISCL1PPCAC_25936, partial [Pristionchus fissidentatus]
EKPEVAIPLRNDASETRVPWFLNPPLCGLNPKTMAVIHLIFMTVFCVGIAAFLIIYLIATRTTDAFPVYVSSFPIRYSIFALPFLALASCGLNKAKLNFLIYPLIALLVLIILLLIFFPVYLGSWELAISLYFLFIIPLLHSVQAIRVFSRVIYDNKQIERRIEEIRLGNLNA